VSTDAIAIRGPALRGVSPRLRLTVQDAVDGVQIEHDRAVTVAPDAGAALRELHACTAPELSTAPAAEQLASAARSGELVAAVAPRQAPRVATLLRRLARTIPPAGPAVLSHGDFNVSQLLEADGQLVLLDFDQACRAAPALDVAGYAANVISGRPGDPEHASAALDALLDGYGCEPDGVQWHLAATTLRRASSPFRLHKKDWPDRMAAILDAAEAMVVA
jgi:Ser/Thr protein kinase RdoA (MazF antagonist)